MSSFFLACNLQCLLSMNLNSALFVGKWMGKSGVIRKTISFQSFSTIMSPHIEGGQSKRSSKRLAEAVLDREIDKRTKTAQGPLQSRSLTTSASQIPKSASLPIKFENGALRITRTPGRRHDKNCVNLADIIHKEHLVSACIYAFFIAKDELFAHLPLSHSSTEVPIYIGRDSNPNMDEVVSQAAAETGIAIREKVAKKQLEDLGPALRDIYHREYGKNCHAFYAWTSGSSHSKILVLVYPTFLRVVITSCNMMAVDTEFNDNHWYIHDLPKLTAQKQNTMSEFESGLLSHLEALGTPQEFIESIRGNYDYSSVKVHLVTSVPGVHSAAKAENHGLLRLRNIVKRLELDLARRKSEERLRLEICAASIGMLSAKWLDGFFDCAIGRKFIEVPDADCEVPKELKIFYPTTDDVVAPGGEPQAGAANIGCHIRPWGAAPKEIKDLFYHYHSKDTGRIFHQKLIIAYNPADTAALPYYVYVGSANLSQSAWGSLENDKRGNEATCDIKLAKTLNFECGVVIPGHILEDLLEPDSRSWHESIVPYDWAAEKYDLNKDKPWNDPEWVKENQGEWRKPYRQPCKFLRYNISPGAPAH